MTRIATVIVPNNIDAAISGVTRIELTARKVKAYGFDPSRAPHVLNRRNGDGVGAMAFHVVIQRGCRWSAQARPGPGTPWSPSRRLRGDSGRVGREAC